TFAAKVDYPTGKGPSSVVMADLNGDGKTDLAVANQSSSSVSVLINNGAGAFIAKLDHATNPLPGSLVAADLNGDGKPDLALLDGTLSSAAVGVLINNGDGTFAAEVDYPAGWAPTSLTVADLNGDGKP